MYEHEHPILICPNCRTPLPVGTNFCAQCGQSVQNLNLTDKTLPSSGMPAVELGKLPNTAYGAVEEYHTPVQDAYPQSAYSHVYPPNTPITPPPPPQIPVQSGRPSGNASNRFGKYGWKITVPAVVIVLILAVVLVSVLAYSNNINSEHIAQTATVQAQHRAATAIAIPTVTAEAQATATAVVNQNPYDPSGKWVLAVDDPLTQQMNFTTYNSTVGSCQFKSNSYHVTAIGIQQVIWCDATQGSSLQFTDFTLQVQMDVLSGDCGGINFCNTGNLAYFAFLCTNGSYSLEYGQSGKAQLTYLTQGTNSPFQHNNHQATVAIKVSGNQITGYVDSRQYLTWTDNTDTQSGSLGFAAWEISSNTDVAFSNLKVWTPA